MPTINQLAAEYIGEATRDPANRPNIYRNAANTLMGFAMDPSNARHAKRLHDVAMQFADAAVAPRPATMRDFDDLLQERREAYDQTGDDPMGEIARAREVHDARTKPDPGHISIAPSSFNRDATLGRSVQIKWDPTAEDTANFIVQSQTVAFWQGVKQEAQAIGVDVSLGFPPVLQVGDAPAATNVRAYAEIEFGSDGNRTKVTCDVAFGRRINVVGNYVSVLVGMDPPGKGGTSLAITAGASIGTFAAPSLAPVVRTLYLDDLLDGGISDPLPIPMKAALLLPIRTTLPIGGTLELRWLDYGGNLIATTFYQQANNSTMLAVPISGQDGFLQVFNNSGHAAGIQLPFQLAV